MQRLHIHIENNQQILFTSDLHLGHRNVLRFCKRPWDNEKDMYDGIIENWNNTVGDNDIVFVLGDVFWFNDSRTIKKTLDKLKGKEIYILPGNHDDFRSYHRVTDTRIHLCEDVVVCWITQDGQKKKEVWMSHYPMMTWPHRENGAYQFFGHIHSKFGGRHDEVDQNLPLHYNQVDVGCDYWNYQPVSLDILETQIKLNKFYKYELD